jgi:hypothetical protein
MRKADERTDDRCQGVEVGTLFLSTKATTRPMGEQTIKARKKSVAVGCVAEVGSGRSCSALIKPDTD